MNSIKNVIAVLSFDDNDNTAIDGIQKAKNKVPNQKIKFANGGDRNNKTTPEMSFSTPLLTVMLKTQRISAVINIDLQNIY